MDTHRELIGAPVQHGNLMPPAGEVSPEASSHLLKKFDKIDVLSKLFNRHVLQIAILDNKGKIKKILTGVPPPITAGHSSAEK